MVIDRVKGNSLLVSMFICESIICSMIVQIIPIPNISVVLMVLIALLSICLNQHFSATRFLRVAIPWIIIVILLLVSGFINGFNVVSNYLVYFIVFGTVAAIVSVNEIDMNLICKDIVIIYMTYILIYFGIIRKSFLDSGNAYFADSMGIAYTMTTIVYLAMICYMFGDVIILSKWIKRFLYIDSVIALFVIMIDCQSRGPVLAIIITFFILLLSRSKGLKKIILIISGGFASVFVVKNFMSIIISLYNLLKRNNIEISALNKIIYLNKSQLGLLNGRDKLYELAINEIKTSPIIGHGVGYYESFGLGYVHNLVLDILLSVGIIGLVVISSLFLYYLRRVLKFSGKKTLAYLFFLLFTGIIMLLFSSSVWLYSSFWVMFFSMVNLKNLKPVSKKK